MKSTSLGGGGRDSWVGEQGRRTMNTQVGGLPRLCINHSHGEAIINILANPWQGSGHGEWEQCPRSSASKARALMAKYSGRSAPGAIWFEGPIMHEKINQSLAHSSHVETDNGRRQRGREH